MVKEVNNMEENEMYDYLLNHGYISNNKKSNYQSELSKERAECIANIHNNLIKQLLQEKQELINWLEEEKKDSIEKTNLIEYIDTINKIYIQEDRNKMTAKAIEYADAYKLVVQDLAIRFDMFKKFDNELESENE